MLFWHLIFLGYRTLFSLLLFSSPPFTSASVSRRPRYIVNNRSLTAHGPDLRDAQAKAALRASPRVLVLNKCHLQVSRYPFTLPAKWSCNGASAEVYGYGSAVVYCRRALLVSPRLSSRVWHRWGGWKWERIWVSRSSTLV